MPLNSTSPATTLTTNGLSAGDRVRCSDFPAITGCVVDVCAPNQIRVRAPYGELLDAAQCWEKTHGNF